MSLKVVMDEANAIKDALAKETPNTGGSLQWQPSYKNDFALADSSDFPAGGLPDGSATSLPV